MEKQDLTPKSTKLALNEEKSSKLKTEIKAHIKETNDRDYLHPLEKKALKKLKRHPLAKGQSDKFLLAFLFARKLNIERTVELLDNHFKFLDKYLPGWANWTFDDLNRQVLEMGYQFQIPGTRDKEGNGLIYLYISNYDKKYGIVQVLMCFTYLFQYYIWKEPLDYWRNGVTYIETIKNFSFSKHVDMTSKNQQISKAMLNCYPFLIKHMYITDAGAIVSTLLSMSKLILKKKLIQRIKVIKKREDLLEFVDPDQLIQDFGGNLEFDPKAWFETLEKECKEHIDPIVLKRRALNVIAEEKRDRFD